MAVLGAGIEENRGHTETFVGIDPGTDHFRNVNRYYFLEMDTLNDLYFPSHGTFAQIRYDRIDPADAVNPDFEQLRIGTVRAFAIGKHSLVLTSDYVRSYGPVSGRHFQQSLGGFLNLSGLPDQALVGNDLVYGSIAYLHRLDEQSILPVDLPVYLGFSLEAGNVWPSHSAVSGGDLIRAGAVLMGVDSPLGGVYLGYGRAEQGDSSFYLKLGRLF